MTESTKKSPKKIIAAAILVIILAIIVILTVRFIRHRIAFAVTDAVFVRTDSLVTVGFDRVSGRIVAMNKKDGDSVSKDEVIARIDATPYKLQVAQLKARLGKIQKLQQTKKLFLRRLRKEVDLNVQIAHLKINELVKQKQAAQANVAALDIEIQQLSHDSRRYSDLAASKAVALTKAENISSKLRATRMNQAALKKQVAAIAAGITIARQREALARAKTLQIAEVEKEIETLNEQIKEVDAALANAHNDLNHCVLKSPISGRVAKRFATAGALTSPQKAVVSLLNPQDIYIVALLEEQKLAGVVPGAPAQITLDAYPDSKYTGVVDCVLPASAATFALAPRDISAGEFTKVAQRIPVRVNITSGDINRLRVGMGAEIEIERQFKQASKDI